MIRADGLDTFVFDQVREILLRPDVLLAGERALIAREPAPDDELLAAQLDRLTRRTERATAERRRLTDPYQAGHIGMKEISRRASELDARHRELTTQQAELTDQRHQLAAGNRLRQRVSDLAKHAADGIDRLDFDCRQRLLRLILEQIRVQGWQVELRLRIPLDTQPKNGQHPKAPAAVTRAAAACQAKTVCVRLVRVNREGLEWCDVYDRQLMRWRAQRREIARLEHVQRDLRVVLTQILELADELGCGTIERQLVKSDLELGLEHLMREHPRA